jgi:hypothetical protein
MSFTVLRLFRTGRSAEKKYDSTFIKKLESKPVLLSFYFQAGQIRPENKKPHLATGGAKVFTHSLSPKNPCGN